MLGRFSIGSVGIAINPTSTIRMLQTVVSTGRLMNRSESDMAGPQRAAGSEPAAAIFTGRPERSRAVLLTTTRSPRCSPESSG